MSTIPGSHVPHKFDLIRAGQYIKGMTGEP